MDPDSNHDNSVAGFDDEFPSSTIERSVIAFAGAAVGGGLCAWIAFLMGVRSATGLAVLAALPTVGLLAWWARRPVQQTLRDIALIVQELTSLPPPPRKPAGRSQYDTGAQAPPAEPQPSRPDDVEPLDWYRIDWWTFEAAVLVAYERNGWIAEMTQPMRDGGLDGILTRDEMRAGVQCKHKGRHEYVGVQEVREFVGALAAIGLRHGYFVTTGQYSIAARSYVRQLSENGEVTIMLHGITQLNGLTGQAAITRGEVRALQARCNQPEQAPSHMRPQHRRRRRW